MCPHPGPPRPTHSSQLTSYRSSPQVFPDLPVPAAREVTVRVTATGPYRVFHWFVLEPD